VDFNDTLLLLASGAYVGISLLLFLLAAYLFYRALRGIARLVRQRAVFGATPLATLIGLGIALLLLPTVVPDFVSALVRITLDFFNGVPDRLASQLGGVREYCSSWAKDSVNFADCAAVVAFAPLRAVASVIRQAAIDAKFVWLPFGDLLLFFVLWAGCSHLLSGALRPARDGQRRWSAGIGKAYHHLGYGGRQNLLLMAILLIGGYLSIAAIAAIPELKPAQVPEPLASDKLAEQLARLSAEYGDVEKRFPATQPRDPFEGLKAKLNEPPPEEVDEKIRVESKRRADVVREALNFADKRRDEVLASWVETRAAASAAQRTAKDHALGAYTATLTDPRGAKEIHAHFVLIQDWFREYIRGLHDELTTCASNVTQMDNRLFAWSLDMQRFLLGTESASFLDRPASPSDVTYAVGDICALRLEAKPVPARPALGAHLGPFSIVAGWLLETEQMSLALVTGLLGFGVLGAAGSSLIRARGKRQPGEPFVADLFGVVVRGLSAAFVVFLAVEGGLTVFAEKSIDPNPYVLLLTCLIAAVFSEDVWNWARRRLRADFSAAEGGSGQTTSSGDTPIPVHTGKGD
jgi:hypothetical protein